MRRPDRSRQDAVRAADTEFARPIEWEQFSTSTRSAIMRAPGRPTGAELLATVRDELRAAHVLARTGALVDASEVAGEEEAAGAVSGSPEQRLVTMWAWRRLGDLATLRLSLSRAARSLGDAETNQKRDHARRQRLESLESALRASGQVIAQVGRIVERHRGGYVTFNLTPAMQRDHRLRRLVRAFAPQTREQWSAQWTPLLSTLPPVNATDIFELWSVARIVRAIESAGWQVTRRVTTPTVTDGVGRPVGSHSVEFARGDLELQLDYNVTPVIMAGAENAPAMHERKRSLLEWSNDNTTAPAGLVASRDLTPDYFLRLSSRVSGARALAIGDATLSDPKHVGGNDDDGDATKVRKLTTYRDHIGWRLADGRLIRCSPAGTFIVLPGPPSHWADVRAFASIDSMLLCPEPEPVGDVEFDRRVGALLTVMQG